MPIKSRPKQAHRQREEEEFLLIKGIANSLSQNASKKAKSGQDGQCETFGSYVCETLQKLEPLSRNIAQHCINNILFQAQMGNTKRKHNTVNVASTAAISSWATTITIATSTANKAIFQPTAPNDATPTAYVPF